MDGFQHLQCTEKLVLVAEGDRGGDLARGPALLRRRIQYTPYAIVERGLGGGEGGGVEGVGGDRTGDRRGSGVVEGGAHDTAHGDGGDGVGDGVGGDRHDSVERNDGVRVI